METYKEPTLELPCKLACPAGIDVPRYLNLIAKGRFAEALAVIREKVPFPATLGRVCSAPCEDVCRTGALNGPVAIRGLKRFVADQDTGLWRQNSRVAPATGKRVAVVGSGPAGLTASYYLAKLGHSVTVYEGLPQPGGMMRVGIPQYRLPKDILDAEIEEIRSAGVEIKTNTRVESVGKLLEQGYDAVLLAVGAHRGQKLPIPGADLNGVLVSIPFLRDVNLGKEVKVGKRVVVLGGGNVAFDCARTALRLGVADVQIACLEPEDGMLATPDEIEQGEEEGITIHPSRTFTKIVSDNRHVSGVECLNVRSFEFDDEGRVHIDSIEGSEHILPADTVIFAIGQVPELGLSDGVSGVKTTKRGTLEVDLVTLATGKEGVFGGGDAVTGPASVIEAIATGRKAASAIDKYLGGKGMIGEVLAPREEVAPLETMLPVGEQAVSRLLPISERLTSFAEVELRLTEEIAINEAKRCLSCDLPIAVDAAKCTGCRICELLCSFRHEEDFNPSRAQIRIRRLVKAETEYAVSFTDECDVCGICARYCPYGALARKRNGGR